MADTTDPAVESPVTIKVEGTRELRRHLNKMKDKELKKKVKEANKVAAAPIVAQAKVEVPVRSGKLKASIKDSSTIKEARVRAGAGARVPYAGPIHFGWPNRPQPSKGWRGGPIAPQPFIYEAMDKRFGEVLHAYRKAMDEFAGKASTTERF